MGKLIDLSQTIYDGMRLFEGDPETKLTKVRDLEEDAYNLHRLETCMHAGTHVDVPMHMKDDTRFVSEFPLEKFCGEGVLVDVRRSICRGEIPLADNFFRKDLENKILLIHTGHGLYYGREEYFTNYPVVSLDLAIYLVEKRIKAIALDTPSPDKFPFALHKKFLNADILIIENIGNLEALSSPKSFEVFAFPLKLEAEASLIRLVARI